MNNNKLATIMGVLVALAVPIIKYATNAGPHATWLIIVVGVLMLLFGWVANNPTIVAGFGPKVADYLTTALGVLIGAGIALEPVMTGGTVSTEGIIAALLSGVMGYFTNRPAEQAQIDTFLTSQGISKPSN